MLLIIIGGEQATGKSWLLERFKGAVGAGWRRHMQGDLTGWAHDSGEYYTFGSSHDGLGKLTKGTMEFLLHANRSRTFRDAVVVLEGPQFFHQDCIEFVNNLNGGKLMIVLEAMEATKAERRRLMRRATSPALLKARAQQIAHIKGRYPEVKAESHEDERDTERLVRWMIERCRERRSPTSTPRITVP